MTDPLAVFVSDELACDRPRAMFGGWGLFRAGMIGLVYQGKVYAKAETDDEQQKFRDCQMGPFEPSRRRTFRTYWEVPPRDCENGEDLRKWFRRC